MILTCRNCGRRFNENKAREGFNSFFKGAYDYDEDLSEPFCFECAHMFAISGILDDNFGYEDEDYEIDDGYVPEGCAACGNPNYPRCTTSCSLFDE